MRAKIIVGGWILLVALTALGQAKPEVCPVVTKLSCGGRRSTQYAGMVVKVNGKDCYLQSGNAPPLRLLADNFNKLYSGDALQCRCNSWIKIGLVTGVDNATCMTLRAADECFEVRSPASTSKPRMKLSCDVVSADALNGQAIVHYGDPAGPKRGDTGPIFSPAFEGAVRPSQFTIRWIPDAELKQMRMRIVSEDRETIWPPENTAATEGQVVAAEGELVSASARERLVRFREQGRLGTLELRVDDSAGNSFRVPFSLLSKHGEQLLEQQLTQCGHSEGEVLPKLCRAAAFENFNLYPEMADEYDQALKLVPKSEDLVQNAIRVNQRTGNIKRVRELSAMLKAGAPSPK